MYSKKQGTGATADSPIDFLRSGALAFPLDTEKGQYLTSKVNSLFSLKRDFMRTSGDKKEKLSIKNDEESSLETEGGLFDSSLSSGGSYGFIIFIPLYSKLLSV
jgi:hypothetical protein